MDTTTSSSLTSTSSECYVNRTYYPHMFLIPAIIIVGVLSFLKKRTSFRKDVWGGRPGIVIPIDFLGVDHDRLVIAATFGATTGSIIQLLAFKGLSDDPWLKAFSVLAVTLEYAVLYYPFFVCLASNHKIIGPIMGMCYVLIWFTVTMVSSFDRCALLESSFLHEVLVDLPIILCNIFVWGKYAVVLFTEIKRTSMPSGNLFSMPEEPKTAKVSFVKPWLYQYVRDLLKPRFVIPDTKLVHYLREIYSPAKNFRFSTQTLSIVVICCILLFRMCFASMTFAIGKLDEKKEIIIYQLNIYQWIGVSLMVSTLISTIFCILTIVRFMECHKNNMLCMFRGDKSFVPKSKSFATSQVMVGRCLKYAGYQIGYFVWGYVLLLVLFFFVVAIGYSLKVPLVRDYFLDFGKTATGGLFFALLTWITLPIVSYTIFHDQSFSKDAIAINNRSTYLVFSYVWFFIGLPMGFVSAILRIIKAMIVGLFMLPRIDRSVMPEGFQQFDPGFRAYVCYLNVQATHRNPVLRVFCQILYDARQISKCPEFVLNPGSSSNSSSSQTSASLRRVRNKWFLLLTLHRNPVLAAERKHVLSAKTPAVMFANSGDVTIQVPV